MQDLEQSNRASASLMSTPEQQVSHHHPQQQQESSILSNLLERNTSLMRQTASLVIDPIADWSLSHRTTITREILLPPMLSQSRMESFFEKGSELVGRNTTEPRGMGLSLKSFRVDEEQAKGSAIDPVTGVAIIPPTFLRVQKIIDEYFAENSCSVSVQQFIRFVRTSVLLFLL